MEEDNVLLEDSSYTEDDILYTAIFFVYFHHKLGTSYKDIALSLKDDFEHVVWASCCYHCMTFTAACVERIEDYNIPVVTPLDSPCDDKGIVQIALSLGRFYYNLVIALYDTAYSGERLHNILLEVMLSKLPNYVEQDSKFFDLPVEEQVKKYLEL